MKRRLQAEPNTRLRNFRQQHHWSQKELAQLVGTTYLTVCRWENGTTSPSFHFRKQLCELFNVQPEELGFVIAAQKTASEPVITPVPTEAPELLPPDNKKAIKSSLPLWHVPYRRDLLFTGRDSLLEQLHTLFRSSQAVALSQVYALSGLGGIGKTQTALEYAYRYRKDYQTVLWVQAETPELLYADLANIAQELELLDKSEHDQERVIKVVKQWLSAQTAWLLILDNIEDLHLVEKILPIEHQGHLLLTTRAQSTGRNIQQLDLKQFELEEGALFLLRRAKLLSPDAPLQASPSQREALQICRLLAGLPLALDQAGAYIEETGCSLQDYLQRYQTGQARLLARRGDRQDMHPASVHTTLTLSCEKAGQANPLSIQILRLCAFLAPDAIPEEMIFQSSAELRLDEQTAEIDALALDEALAILRKYSLLRRNAETKMFTVHRLVQAVVRAQIDAAEQTRLAHMIVRIVNQTLPNVETTAWSHCARFLPHAYWTLQLIETEHLSSLPAAQLLDHMGIYLNLLAQPQEAEKLYLNAKALREQIVGTDHLEIAISLYKLGDFYTDQGQYKQAEPLLYQALTLWEANLSPYAPQIAQTLDSLGKLEAYLGRYAEAEDFLKRAEKLWEQIEGANHPATANTLHSLGIIYKLQSKLTQAEDAYNRSLAIWQEHVGIDNPNTPVCMLDLASLYIDQDKVIQAEALLKQTLSIQEKLLGLEHIDVSRTFINLARLYDKQGKYNEAEPYYLRALAVRERVLGPEAPLVANCLHNLAEIYVLQQRFADAATSFQRALDIRQQHLGNEHPYTKATQQSYSALKVWLATHTSPQQ